MQSNKILRTYIRSQLNEFKTDSMIAAATKDFFKNLPDDDDKKKSTKPSARPKEQASVLARVGKFAAEIWIYEHESMGVKFTPEIKKKVADETNSTYAQLHKSNQNSHKKAIASLVKNLDSKFSPKNRLSPAQTQDVIDQVFDKFTSDNTK